MLILAMIAHVYKQPVIPNLDDLTFIDFAIRNDSADRPCLSVVITVNNV